MGEGLIVRRGGALGEPGIFIEPGLIVEFFGLSTQTPEGWLLCDGTNGTPDLIDKFIIGAGDTYSVGDTGGFADSQLPSHTHTVSNTDSVGTHNHSFTTSINQDASNQNLGPANGSGINTSVNTHSHTITTNTQGTSATNTNLPPYLSLVYIIKEEN